MYPDRMGLSMALRRKDEPQDTAVGPKQSHAAITLAVIAAALGFFVDAYDLLLYSIVRNQTEPV